MIPKIIHYCWLSGDPYPPLITQCIASWKKYLPEYEFILWDTNKININSNLWLKQSFENRKYAFAADYIRFYALFHYGGIYLDTDVEVIKSFNPLLLEKQFIGEESSGDIEAAVIGVEKGCDWIKECMDYYKDRHFIKDDGSFDMRPVPLLVNSKIKNRNINVKPFYYFSPKDYNIGRLSINEETYCIHHFDGKWVKRGVKHSFKRYIHKMIYFILGRDKHNQIVHIIRKFK